MDFLSLSIKILIYQNFVKSIHPLLISFTTKSISNNWYQSLCLIVIGLKSLSKDPQKTKQMASGDIFGMGQEGHSIVRPPLFTGED